ncbi:hypothetical protein BGW36DRAFT_378044 [Talaromyces proteolyticus]|uniref:Uncharacterized protein n=1 Tax=Talaromyces proteolyticus TaxID=1131652 RepID=A0AAD4KS24_9EURO|nr:uncharacterized protein BGW36DRAFT_378044 [Talaromyces proteolyticus]KAH8697137.1 hypothetical protein BGW36DRAFT_378044 [Talaromyces proteolyticus]
MNRNTIGDVALKFNVFPREVDITTPIRPWVDMHAAVRAVSSAAEDDFCTSQLKSRCIAM